MGRRMLGGCSQACLKYGPLEFLKGPGLTESVVAFGAGCALCGALPESFLSPSCIHARFSVLFSCTCRLKVASL